MGRLRWLDPISGASGLAMQLGRSLVLVRILIGQVLALDHRKTGSASWLRFERRLAVSFVVAARLLPRQRLRDDTSPAETLR